MPEKAHVKRSAVHRGKKGDSMNVQTQGAAAKGSESQDLERVRDILFGGQARDIDQRIRTIQDDLQAKLSAAREELEKASKELEARLAEKVEGVKKELDSTKKDLESEKTARGKAVEEASEKARKSLEEVEKRFTKITDEMEEGKPDRSELAQMFRHIASELAGDERPPAGNAAKASGAGKVSVVSSKVSVPGKSSGSGTEAQDFFRELQVDASR